MKGKFRWLIVLFSVMLIVTSCSSNTKEGKNPVKPANSADHPVNSQANEKSPEEYKGEITIWSWYSDWSKEYIKLFNQTYPNIKVNLVSYSHDDYFTKLYLALQGGSGAPDVIEIDDKNISKLVNSGQLQELNTPGFEVDTSLFFESVVDEFTNKEGQLVGLPEVSTPGGIWYNRAVAKEYLGTDDPDEISKMIGSGENTYKKFVDTMKVIVDKSNGKVKGVASLEDMIRMLHVQKGNKFFDGNKIIYEREYQEDYALLEEIASNKLSANLTVYDQPWMQSFINDSVAFYPGAVWFLGYTIPKDDTQKGKWAFIPSPGPGWTIGDQVTAVWKHSKNKELAWIWAKWFCMTKEAQMLQYDVGLQPPGLKELFSDPKFTSPDPFLNQAMGPIFNQILETSVVKDNSQNAMAMIEISHQVVKELEVGKLNAGQTMEKVVTESMKRLKDVER